MNFRLGDTVRILQQNIAGHHRVPGYVMGKNGIVTAQLDTETIPEEAALGSGNPGSVPVYLIKLKQADLWQDYTGSEHDTLEIEIYQHWLAPISNASAHTT